MRRGRKIFPRPMCLRPHLAPPVYDPILVLASAITFCDTFAIGLVNPIYTVLVQSEVLGATRFAALQSTANAASLAASTVFGRLSDVHGRRAAIIASAGCTLVGYICYVLGFFCNQPELRLFLPAAGRVLSGVGRAALSGPLLALLAEHAHDKTLAVSRTMATFGIGYATGSACGGFVVAACGPEANLLLISSCSAMQVLCAVRLPRGQELSSMKESPSSVDVPVGKGGSNGGARTERLSTWAALCDCLSTKGFAVLLLLQALASASFQVYDATSALYLQDALGYTSSQRGYLLAYAGQGHGRNSGISLSSGPLSHYLGDVSLPFSSGSSAFSSSFPSNDLHHWRYFPFHADEATRRAPNPQLRAQHSPSRWLRRLGLQLHDGGGGPSPSAARRIWVSSSASLRLRRLRPLRAGGRKSIPTDSNDRCELCALTKPAHAWGAKPAIPVRPQAT